MADADQFFGAATPAAPASPPPAAGQAAALPSADQFFGPAGGLPPPQTGPAHDAIWSQAASWIAGQGAAEQTAGVRRLNAAGQGFQDAWGARPLGLSDEAEAGLRKAGIFNDYVSGHETLAKSFNEAIIRPAASAIDLAMRLPSAVLAGAGAGEAETAQEAATSKGPLSGVSAYAHGAASELLSGAAEGAFGGEIGGEPIGAAHYSAAEVAAEDATRARSVGALGEGEAGYYDAALPTPENVQARAQAAADLGEPPTPPLPPPPDVHALARRIDPETFQEYDALGAEAALHRDTIAKLGQDRVTSPEAVAAQGDIDTILGRVNGVESRLTNAAAGRLAEAQDRLDTITSTDTPEMAAARDRLIGADQRMRELAPDVSAAYRSARDIAPALPEEAPVAEGEAQAAGEQSEAGEAAKPAEEVQAGPVAAEAPVAEGGTGVAPIAASAEGEAAVAPPNVVGEKLGAPAAEAEATPAPPALEQAVAEAAPAPAGRTSSALKAIQGSDEEGIRRVSERSEENAIAAGLADTFGDIPTYGVLKDADQAAIVTKLMGEDYGRAKAIAMGEREPPKGATPEAFLIGVENRALAEGDFDTAYRLKDSKLAKAGTTMGQRLSTYRTRTQASPVAAIQEVQAAREAALAARNVDVAAAKAQTVAEIKTEVRAAASKPAAWESFIQSITCSTE